MDDNSILVIQPSTWSEAVEFARQNSHFVFRGQADARWGLSTKMERICWRNQFPTNFLRNREDTMLREFQRRAHHYIENPPSLDNKLEWLALIQHYGGSTRLLDFTKSFYIAAFFAMELAQKDAAVWALNDEYLYQHTDNIIGQGETIYQLHDKSRRIVEENLSGNHEARIVMSVEPERLNERITIQQGLFIIPGSFNHPFAENLAATLEVEYAQLVEINQVEPVVMSEFIDKDQLGYGLVKIILPLEMHNAALLDLESMNISASTLFPGLEGFARSLDKYLRDVT